MLLFCILASKSGSTSYRRVCLRLEFVLFLYILNQILRCYHFFLKTFILQGEKRFPCQQWDYPPGLFEQGYSGLGVGQALTLISRATIAQYSKPLRLKWFFCNQRRINCFAPSETAVLEFLSFFFLRSGSYSILNSYRSATSLICTEKVNLHPLVRRFFKGVTTLRPQKARYNFVWHPFQFSSYLVTLYPYKELSLELSSKNLAASYSCGS